MRAYLSNLIGETPLRRALAVGAGYGALGYLCLIFTRFGAPVDAAPFRPRLELRVAVG